MQIALLALFIGALLIPGLAQKVESTMTGIGGAVFAGPVNVAVNAWMKVALIGGVAVLGVWLIETKVAKHEGVAGPAAPSARDVVQQGPTFNPSGGFTAGPGGVSATGGINRRRVITVTPVSHAELLRRRAA